MSNMVYNIHCEYAKMHSFMYKYASERARMPARVVADRPQISGGKVGNVAQLARIAATDTAQAGGALQELRRVWRNCALLAGGR